MRGYVALLSAVGLEVFGTFTLKFASLGQLPLGWLLRGCLKPVSPTLYVPHHPQAHNLPSSIQLLAA